MNYTPAPITDEEVQELENFLFGDNVPEECMTLSEIDGFLTALAAGPELVLPSEWLPVIWQGEGPSFDSPQELERVLALILALNARTLDMLQKGEIAPMFNIEVDEDDNELMTPDGWCWGFMEGVALREAAWQPLFDSEEDGDLLDPIAMIAGGGRESAEFEEIQNDPEAYEEFLDLISGSALDVYDFWREQGGKPMAVPKNLH